MAVDGSTVIVDLRWFAAVDVDVKLNGREPDEVWEADGILRHVFKAVEPGKHSVQINDVMGFSESREIEVEAPSPTPTPTTAPTATPAPKPTATATPKPTPSLAPEEAAHAVLSQILPWYNDLPYPGALVPIIEIWLRDPDMGRELAQAPWIIDGIARLEDDAVYGPGFLFDHDPALAQRMLAYSTEEPVQSRDVLLLSNLGEMLSQHKDKFERPIALPWFADGLDAEERTFITALRKTAGVDALYEGLLASRTPLTTTISLPLAGEVTLWVFYNGPPPQDADILAAVERGVRGAERFMGAPFPLTDLIILSLRVEDCDIGCGGVNFLDSLVLIKRGGMFIGERTLYHEIAHFYLTAEGGPFWLYEGGANFVAEHVVAQAESDGGLWLDEHALQYCPGAGCAKHAHAQRSRPPQSCGATNLRLCPRPVFPHQPVQHPWGSCVLIGNAGVIRAESRLPVLCRRRTGIPHLPQAHHAGPRRGFSRRVPAPPWRAFSRRELSGNATALTRLRCPCISLVGWHLSRPIETSNTGT